MPKIYKLFKQFMWEHELVFCPADIFLQHKENLKGLLFFVTSEQKDVLADILFAIPEHWDIELMLSGLKANGNVIEIYTYDGKGYEVLSELVGTEDEYLKYGDDAYVLPYILKPQLVPKNGKDKPT